MRQSRTSGSAGGPGRATARVYPTTVPAYREFLEKRPEAAPSIRTTAEKRTEVLIEKAWAQAQGEDSISGYEQFLELNPHEQLVEQAHARMRVIRHRLERERAAMELMKAIRTVCYKELKRTNNLARPIGISSERRRAMLDKIKALLENGADPNSLRYEGFSPARSHEKTEQTADHVGTTYYAISGSLGTIVPAEKGGESALEIAEAAKDEELAPIRQ